jgi:hypothetical protein
MGNLEGIAKRKADRYVGNQAMSDWKTFEACFGQEPDRFDGSFFYSGQLRFYPWHSMFSKAFLVSKKCEGCGKYYYYEMGGSVSDLDTLGMLIKRLDQYPCHSVGETTRMPFNLWEWLFPRKAQNGEM